MENVSADVNGVKPEAHRGLHLLRDTKPFYKYTIYSSVLRFAQE